MPTLCVVAILQAKPLTKLSRANSNKRWDARKTKPASAEPSAPHHQALVPPTASGVALATDPCTRT
jgi:hypothetical protein